MMNTVRDQEVGHLGQKGLGQEYIDFLDVCICQAMDKYLELLYE